MLGIIKVLFYPQPETETRLLVIKKSLHVGTNIASFKPQFNDALLGYERETRQNPLLQAAQNDHIETVEILFSESRPSRIYMPS